MKDPSNQSRGVDRRNFLEAGARYLLFGGLMGYFVQQRLRAARLVDDPNCIRLNTCSDCIEFSGCALPKSEAFRSARDSHEGHDHGSNRPL